MNGKATPIRTSKKVSVKKSDFYTIMADVRRLTAENNIISNDSDRFKKESEKLEAHSAGVISRLISKTGKTEEEIRVAFKEAYIYVNENGKIDSAEYKIRYNKKLVELIGVPRYDES